MKNLFVLITSLFMCISLYSQRDVLTDTVYVDSYKMPRELSPNDLVDEIKNFLTSQNYDIIEDSPIETNGRKDNFEKNNAGWFARNFLGRKELKKYPFTIKHKLTFDQNKNGRNYVVIYSFAELESKSLSEETIEDIIEDAMRSAEKIAKEEFNSLKRIVKDKGSMISDN